MVSFATKIAQLSRDTVYHIEQAGEGDIEIYSYLIAVMPHKQMSFENAFASNETLRAEDFGRIMYYGAGSLTSKIIEEILSVKY